MRVDGSGVTVAPSGTRGGASRCVGSVNELTKGDLAGRATAGDRGTGGGAGGNCRLATLAAILGVRTRGEVRRISFGES